MKSKLDLPTKIFFLLVFASAYFLAIPYPDMAREFPSLITSCSLVVLAASLFMDFFAWYGKRSAEVKSASVRKVDQSSAMRTRFMLSWAIIMVSTLAGLFGGFLLTAFLLLVGFPVVFEVKKRRVLVKDVALAVALTICVYLLFDKLMGVPLLSGLLIDL